MYKMYVLFAMLLALAFILLLVTVYLTNRSNMKDPKAQLATNAFKSNDLLAFWSFDEGSGKVSEDKVSGIKDPIKYVFNEAKYKPSTDPLRKAGVKGGSLLFDGYSTWIERSAEKAFKPGKALTIEVWVAPKNYEWGDGGKLSTIINQYDSQNKQGYALGMYRHGSWSFQIGTGKEWVEVWSEEKPLLKNKWSHVVGVFDGASGTVAIYLNGEKVGSASIAEGSAIAPCERPLLIGKNNEGVDIGGPFTANMFSGLMDELKVYSRAMSEEEVKASYNDYIKALGNGALPEPELHPDRSLYAGDRHRPQYHFIAPEKWMNEPHGPIYFNGKYHIFYQHNPQGPYWHHIHWGHAVSDDMVHWKDLPIALSPEKGEVDPDGCWSGCTVIDDNGIPVILYTAGDDSKVPNTMIGLARSTFKADQDSELKTWIKEKTPVLVQKQGEGMYKQFRDPFAWKEGDTWYMLVGSGMPDKGGTALVYTSKDLVSWEYRNPLYVGDQFKYPKTGQVWELPVLFPIGTDKQGNKKHIFIINPWFNGVSPYTSKNIWYWIGVWDKENCKFIPDDEEPQIFDYGEHFTGPSGLIDDKGRVILFSIAQDGRTGLQQYLSGWAHNAGIPLILSLGDDGKLRIEPIPEFQSLRKEKLASFTNKSIKDANELLKNIKGDMLEIIVELENVSAESYGMKVRSTEDGQEETVIFYDSLKKTLNVDRLKSSKASDVRKGIQGGEFSLDGNTLKLHIYLDRSMVEVYANNTKSITTRVYPTREDALGVSVWANGDVTVKSMEIWSMNSAY